MKRMNLASYEAMLKIDKNALDDELIRQPEVLFHIAREVALAISRRDEKHAEYKRVAMERGEHWRNHLEVTKKGQRVTNKMVDEAVESDSDYRDAKESHLQSCLEADRWMAMKEAWQSRGFVLRDLVQLHLVTYWERDSAHEERRRRINEKRQELNRERINSKGDRR